MKVKSGMEAVWQEIQRINDDPYSRRCVTYAEDWANLMETRLAQGESIENMAESTRKEADFDGITGFMHGAGVSILAKVWEHGDTLRRWHNLDTQIGHEGERANERGTVLNPALLNIGVPKE